MFRRASLLLPTLLIANGCLGDPMVVAHQKETIAKHERMIAELTSTMDEQGEVIVEQIKMMSEMQTTIDKQRSLMKETTETLRECAARQ